MSVKIMYYVHGTTTDNELHVSSGVPARHDRPDDGGL